jgi:hypothetical protein
MKYAFITSALGLATTVVGAYMPPTYGSYGYGNSGNVESSPVASSSRPVESSPVAESARPEGYSPAASSSVAPKPVASSPVAPKPVVVSPVAASKPSQSASGNTKPIEKTPATGGQQQESNTENQQGSGEQQESNTENMQSSPSGSAKPVVKTPTGSSQQQQSSNEYSQQKQVNTGSVSGNKVVVPVAVGTEANSPAASQSQAVSGATQAMTGAASTQSQAASGAAGAIPGAASITQGFVGDCLTYEESAQFVQRFSGVLDQSGSDLGDLNVTANALVTETFVERSNSILSVQGLSVS